MLPLAPIRIKHYSTVITRRKQARNLVTDPSARTVRCRCGRALGVVFDSDIRPDGVTAVMTGGVATWGSRHPNGLKNLIHEDWISIVCKRCGHDWQGRQRQLRALIQSGNDTEVSLTNIRPAA